MPDETLPINQYKKVSLCHKVSIGIPWNDRKYLILPYRITDHQVTTRRDRSGMKVMCTRDRMSRTDHRTSNRTATYSGHRTGNIAGTDTVPSKDVVRPTVTPNHPNHFLV